MPQREYFSENALIVLQLQGDVDSSELRLTLPDLHLEGAPADIAYDALIDLSQTGNIDSSYASLSAMVSAKDVVYRSHRAPRQIVFFAPGDLAFGTCRMLEQIAQDRLPTTILVTRDIHEAMAHLGREDPSLPDCLAALRRAEAQATAARRDSPPLMAG